MKYTKCFLISAVFLLFSTSFAAAEGIAEGGGSSRIGRSYYVSASGSDFYNGLSEKTSFKTLAKAVDAAASSSVKRITVIGTLDGASEVTTLHLPSDPDSVFCIMYSGGSEIVISGKQHTETPAALKGGDDKRVINIRGQSHIRFEHILISGGETEYEGGGIFAEGGAAIVLGEGAVLTGNHSSEGGGIYVHTGSLLMEKDASVWGNSVSTDEGGGVVVVEGAFAMMENAIINSNSGGGLILVGSEGSMSDSAAITDNHCEYSGGGVMAYLSNFTMRGNSRVSRNKAGADGGGIHMEGGMLLLSEGASVNDNEAGNDGGGINLEKASMIASGYAEIRGNYSGDDGGGIHNQGGYLILSEYMTLIENESTCGGGLCIENYASAIIRDDAVITGNRAFDGPQGGGGLCAGYNSNIHMLGGEVFGNAAERGGGVYLEGASLIVDNGFITNNHAEEGGGVYAASQSFLRIGNDSFVSENTLNDIHQK